MYCMMIIFNVLNIVIDSFVIIKERSVSKFHDTVNAVDPKISFTTEVIPSLKSVWECFFKWADPPDSQNGFQVLPYIKGITE